MRKIWTWFKSIFTTHKSTPLPSYTPKEPPISSDHSAGSLAYYQDLWDSCELRPEHADRIKWSINRILPNIEKYKFVQKETGVPWPLIAAIHGLESSFDFGTCLHNGDPLGHVTTHEPKGRGPFFSWESAAIDALQLDGLNRVEIWSTSQMLKQAERYNGTGYLDFHPDVKSPYLWSCTNHYSKGKYGSDGKWNPNLVSEQVGVAAILKQLEELKVFIP